MMGLHMYVPLLLLQFTRLEGYSMMSKPRKWLQKMSTPSTSMISTLRFRTNAKPTILLCPTAKLWEAIWCSYLAMHRSSLIPTWQKDVQLWLQTSIAQMDADFIHCLFDLFIHSSFYLHVKNTQKLKSWMRYLVFKKYFNFRLYIKWLKFQKMITISVWSRRISHSYLHGNNAVLIKSAANSAFQVGI